MQIQLAVGPDDIVLFAFNLPEYILRGGLGLPLPVEPRHAAGQQLTGLFKLRFLRIDFAYSGLHLRAVFSPQVEIPAGGQTKGAIGVPRPGGACRRVGNGEGPHQPFGGHFLTFGIR